jgi:UDP-4-amino-4,6-dideoxy-N-acetyl-beta-L-altrosamine transaminase
LIPYSRQTVSFFDALYVARQIKFKSLTQGLKIDNFEEKVAKYVGARFAVAVSSGTAGLHLAHLALGQAPGSKVITSPISFVASANSIIYAGQEPIFIDINPNTGNISVEKLREAISRHQIKTVVPVHYAGFPCEMEKIFDICQKESIHIIEDAAHALGAQYSTGEKIGSCKYSDLTVFSFHPVKSITTGEGGIITTNNEDLYLKLIKLRTHGIAKNDQPVQNKILGLTNGRRNAWYYEMEQLGFHYRLTEIQAALGISQMRKIDKFISKRRKVAKRYNKSFKKLKNIEILKSNENMIGAFHLYPIKIKFDKIIISKNDLIQGLKKIGIMSQVHYIPIPLHPYYKNLGYTVAELPNAIDFYHRILSIPIYPGLSILKQRKVIRSLNKLIR